MNRSIRNVFQDWKDDTKEDQQMAFEIDSKASKQFSLFYLALDKDDCESCMNFLKSNYNVIKAFYRNL